ncbi:hypothetical protein B0H17DRAFT_1053707 [Mycena rosella]|uniref:CID domain-containing protein n=1 Tax=Mycena rosella TaxID=1033263 RepID=A0AAD7DPE4_MYCRO|nr:hypothetical protein B0H17DRAFT_1053707 [Mycena rosella]
MAQLSEFETALKEIVHAKRLSASKMNNLTEIALRSMENDTQLVSILYRTHKSLQPPAKVSSLYVFDALARAARSQAVKQNLTGDINSGKGNCATFLLKVEGVLEGLFQDMIAAAAPESKVSSTTQTLSIGTIALMAFHSPYPHLMTGFIFGPVHALFWPSLSLLASVGIEQF